MHTARGAEANRLCLAGVLPLMLLTQRVIPPLTFPVSSPPIIAAARL